MSDTLTLDRTEYDSAAHFGTAGQASALSDDTVTRWRSTHPDWKGKHWGYSPPDAHGARHAHPINLAPKSKK